MHSPIVTPAALDDLSLRAQLSDRRRFNLNLHDHLEAPVQRLFNALEPETYIPPHRHAREEGWELMVAVRGHFSILLFEDDGRLRSRHELSPEGPVLAFEIPPRSWHSVVAMATRTILLEIKEGPYSPLPKEDFAPWAPTEQSQDREAFLAWMKESRPGDYPPPQEAAAESVSGPALAPPRH